MFRITVKEVEHVAFRLAREKLGFDEHIPDFSTRFPRVLESCLSAPFLTFDKKDFYPDFLSKVSILFYLMITNSLFLNNNKRVALTTLFYVLLKRKKWIKADIRELYNFAVWVAQSPPDAKEEVVGYIEKFLKKHMVPIEE
jgi:death-on-curing protein